MNTEDIQNGIWSRNPYGPLREIQGLGDVSSINPLEIVTTLWPHVEVAGTFGPPTVQVVGDVQITIWKVQQKVWVK